MASSQEDIRPYVLVHIREDGVEKVRLSASTPKIEAQSIELYTEVHHIIRQIDRVLKTLNYGGSPNG